MACNYKTNVIADGNEAVAWGAISAGVNYFAHYPGSPINKVEPAIKELATNFSLNICFNDSLNEHIAALSSAGASYCGARSLLVMKHVGLNIAADPLNYIGYTGVKGGMAIVVGTDPGANSSTGEEDTHWYAPQFNFPLFEPTTVKEIYSFVKNSFEISEKYELPILIFIPGRLCYNSDTITIPENVKKNYSKRKFRFIKNSDKYINVGNKAVRNHQILIEKISRFAKENDYSKTYFNENAKIGLITRGLTLGHTFEAISRLCLSDKVHLLNLDLVYPSNRDKIHKFVDNKEQITIIEDQDGFLEYYIKNLIFNNKKCNIFGKNIFQKHGEITYDQVHAYLIKLFNIDKKNDNSNRALELVNERLGTFCEGCPHRAIFYAIEKAIKKKDGIIGGDIGCSSLPPFRADWLMCMNAGIGISQGIAHIQSNQTVISTGGESTFFHGGFISLQSAVLNKIQLLHIVFDNRVIGMTGRQDSPTTNNTVKYRKLLNSIGVKRVSVVSALKPRRFIRILNREIKQKGVRVIWVNTPCAQVPTLLTDIKRMVIKPIIDNTLCRDCSQCYEELRCPSILKANMNYSTYEIDTKQCMRCGVCRDICPNNAIKAKLMAPLTELLIKTCKLIYDRRRRKAKIG